MYSNTDYDYNAALFGEKIRVLREKKGLTQDTLAVKLDVNIRTIYNIETGKTKTAPRLDTVVKLCNVLNCDPSYLLTNTDYTKPIYKEIHDMTGLTEETIKVLEDINYMSSENEYRITILNSLLSDYKNMYLEEEGIRPGEYEAPSMLELLELIHLCSKRNITFGCYDQNGRAISNAHIGFTDYNEKNTKFTTSIFGKSNILNELYYKAFIDKITDFFKDFIKRNQ